MHLLFVQDILPPSPQAAQQAATSVGAYSKSHLVFLQCSTTAMEGNDLRHDNGAKTIKSEVAHTVYTVQKQWLGL